MDEPTPASLSAGKAVSDSLRLGWERMLYLLFRGPDASLRSWLVWGVILLIAGVGGANFGSNWHSSLRDRGDVRFPDFEALEPWMIAAGLAALAALMVLGLVWMYFLARFSFVMLEGVRAGRPRIREVFGRTGRAGTPYFVVLLALALAQLLLASPVVLAWIPVARRALRGEVPRLGELIPLLIVTAVWIVTLAVVGAVVNWWIYDLALPYVWLGGIEFRAGLVRAWNLTRERPDAVLLFLVLRILVAIAGVCAACVLGCAACALWLVPALLLVAAVVGSMEYPLLWILTAPLILVLTLVVMWIMATVTAPIPLLYRAWSWAFVHRLDPSLPLWDDGSTGGAAAP